jgi:hypothetical protein
MLRREGSCCPTLRLLLATAQTDLERVAQALNVLVLAAVLLPVPVAVPQCKKMSLG